MSDAIRVLHDYLAKSPSVVYPEDVLAYLPAIEDENARLRELVRDMWHDGMCECDERGACAECEYGFPARMHELGVEVP